MALPPSAVRAFYDRFGAKQDAQSFYEDPGVNRLIVLAGFNAAGSAFEFGCGTGRLAERLLREALPSGATYLGADLSPVMVNLSRARLAPFGVRAVVHLTDGSIRFPVGAASVDRVVSTYVLDLLSDEDIRRFLGEARRVLRPTGRLCLVSLADGVGPVSRFVSALWTTAYRLRPTLVGGCRPIRLTSFFNLALWTVTHRETMTPFGVPSEILVAAPRPDPAPG